MAPRVIVIQFTMSNPVHIPTSIPEKEPEKLLTSHQRRIVNHKGAVRTQVVEKTFKCDVSELPDMLDDAGYYLVSVWQQRRRDRKDPTKFYYNVRYTFATGDEAPAKLKKLREEYDLIEDDMLTMFAKAHWDVRAYLNRRESDGGTEEMLSINLDGIQPLFEKAISPETGKVVLDEVTGEPVMVEKLVWRRDAEGNKIGDHKEPPLPKATLLIDTNCTVKVESVETTE